MISGNNGEGISITSSNNTIILSNAIGTDVNCKAALPNFYGVYIGTGTGNLIGRSSNSALVNIISGNSQGGILIRDAGNSVAGNVIGADLSGTSPLSNGGAGVKIDASNNTVGMRLAPNGTAAGQPNIIDFNTGAGVLISSGTGNSILGNQIFGNQGLGIQLAAGANGSQAAPVLQSVVTQGGQTTVTVNVTMQAAGVCRVEVFANPSTDPSGSGEGAVYVGATAASFAAPGTTRSR